MNWLSLHCFIWRCFRGTASLRCTTATGSQVNLGIFSCLLEEWLDLWLVAVPLRQSATWWCCSLVHLRLAPIKTELLTCTELHDIGGSHWYPCFSQTLVWIIVSSLPFSLLNNFSYWRTLQNHVVLLCFGPTLPTQTCLGLMQLRVWWFVPTASVWTMKPVSNREGDAAALKHPRAYSLLV